MLRIFLSYTVHAKTIVYLQWEVTLKYYTTPVSVSPKTPKLNETIQEMKLYYMILISWLYSMWLCDVTMLT